MFIVLMNTLFYVLVVVIPLAIIVFIARVVLIYLDKRKMSKIVQERIANQKKA